MKKILSVRNESDLDDDFEFDYDETELMCDAVAAYFKFVVDVSRRPRSYKVLEMTRDFFNKADKAGFIYYHNFHGPMFGNVIVEVCDEIV